MALLDVDNLTVGVTQDGERTLLVKDVSYSINAGETLAIVGESGSGKSVSSLAIMGLLAKSLSVLSGRILFEGRDLVSLGADQMRGKISGCRAARRRPARLICWQRSELRMARGGLSSIRIISRVGCGSE